MFGWSNPFTALFRMINWRGPDLDLAVAAPLSNPFISNIAATTPIILGANGNSTAIIRFNVLDGLGVADTTNAVTVKVSSATQTVSIAATTGTIVTKETALASLGQTVTVIPGTAGLVHLVVTFGAAAADAKFAIQSRHVCSAIAVAVT